MSKEWTLLVASVVVTVAAALGLVRWLAPGLLGVPTDLQLVQVDKAVVPFYEGVFRREDHRAYEFQLQDPYTKVRNRPLLPVVNGVGPHDILGFRNRQVPNVADVVVIGDSQTYGNNALIAENWPHQLETTLQTKQASVYSMAAGGWGAVQYWDMFLNAPLLRPRAIIVAYYSGNDPLESFSMAYGSDHWAFLRPDKNLEARDAPSVAFPPPPESIWSVTFADGSSTAFTPELRLASNTDHPAARAGWAIVADTARRIANEAQRLGIEVLFTVIPTKELVYAERIADESLTPPDAYAQLVRNEASNIEAFAEPIRALPNARYVDTVTPLQAAAREGVPLYPSDTNGHPVAPGYRVIATTFEQALAPLLPDPVRGLHALQLDAETYQFVVVTEEGAWIFPNQRLIELNGWEPGRVDVIQPRDLASVPVLGLVQEVDPARFGPGGG